jgi:nucleotide-binding universal stress UspA family protein
MCGHCAKIADSMFTRAGAVRPAFQNGRPIAMTKLLVPVDGSEASMRALRHAISQGGEIHIINVQAKADTPTLLLHMTQEDIDKAQRSHCESMLEGARKLLEAAGRPYRAHSLLGEPAEQIACVAKAEKVDGIVMGTRGMSAFGNLALGSTATKVVHLADVPVTLVK